MRNVITVHLPHDANEARMRSGVSLVGLTDDLRKVEISCEPSLQAEISEDLLSQYEYRTDLVGELAQTAAGLVLRAEAFA